MGQTRPTLPTSLPSLGSLTARSLPDGRPVGECRAGGCWEGKTRKNTQKTPRAADRSMELFGDQGVVMQANHCLWKKRITVIQRSEPDPPLRNISGVDAVLACVCLGLARALPGAFLSPPVSPSLHLFVRSPGRRLREPLELGEASGEPGGVLTNTSTSPGWANPPTPTTIRD